jgi:hypothetical protein
MPMASGTGSILAVALLLSFSPREIPARSGPPKTNGVHAGAHTGAHSPPEAMGKKDTDFVYALDPIIHPLRLGSGPGEPDTTIFGKPTKMLAIDTEWNSTPIVVGFFDEGITQVWIKDSSSRERFVSGRTDGYVFVPTPGNPNQCRRFAMEAFGDSGAKGEILSVIFANADRDRRQEMGILIRTAINVHGDGDGCDTFYDVYFFDDLAAAVGDSLKPLRELNRKIGYTVQCLGATDEEHAELYTGLNRRVHAPAFRNSDEVKARLKRLGY